MQHAYARQQALIDRWLRLQMHVRCGLSAQEPGSVRLYLQTGLHLCRLGVLPAATVHLRMLHNLLQAANDEALPWFWRSVCLEHVSLPLAQASTLLTIHDPLAMQAIEAAVQKVRERLVPPNPGTVHTPSRPAGL
jgi:hypothetical protein